jgi:two-component system sensor kinase FixL
VPSKAGSAESVVAEATGRRAAPFEFSPARSESEHSLLEYQVIFENAIVGICSMRNRLILRCNRRFEEIFGYGSGELYNRSVRTLYPTQEAFDRVGKVYPSFAKLNQYVHEPQLVRKDGKLIWCIVSGRVLDRRQPERDSVWVVQDITERKLAEDGLRRLNKRLELRVEQRTTNLRRINQALKMEVQRRKEMQHALVESREKYRALFRTFPIGISITDDEGNIVEVNRTLHRMTGQQTIAGIQRIGMLPLDLIRADGSEVERNSLVHVRAARDKRRVEDGEIGVRRPDGSYVWLSTTAAPIPVNGYGAVAAYTDITERKEAIEQEKRQQSEFARVARMSLMGEMASALAHELGQPLTCCLSYLDGAAMRLRAGGSEPAELIEALMLAKRQAEQAGEIVKRVKNYVRRHRPERRPTDLNEIFCDVVAFLGFELRSQGASVHFALTPDMPAAFVDRVEIEQVVLNLLRNALDAVSELPAKRRVLEVTTRARGKRSIEGIVSDRGCGLPKNNINRIFDPYFTTKQDGLGLGLSICRTIVESHGGKLNAVPLLPHGAAFSFTLPRRQVVT